MLLVTRVWPLRGLQGSIKEQTEMSKSKEVLCLGLRTGLWGRKNSIQNLASPPALRVILGKLLDISVVY